MSFYPESPLYAFVRIRIVGLAEIVEGVGHILVGERMPPVALRLMVLESNWLLKRKMAAK